MQISPNKVQIRWFCLQIFLPRQTTRDFCAVHGEDHLLRSTPPTTAALNGPRNRSQDHHNVSLNVCVSKCNRVVGPQIPHRPDVPCSLLVPPWLSIVSLPIDGCGVAIASDAKRSASLLHQIQQMSRIGSCVDPSPPWAVCMDGVSR